LVAEGYNRLVQAGGRGQRPEANAQPGWGRDVGVEVQRVGAVQGHRLADLAGPVGNAAVPTVVQRPAVAAGISQVALLGVVGGQPVEHAGPPLPVHQQQDVHPTSLPSTVSTRSAPWATGVPPVPERILRNRTPRKDTGSRSSSRE